MVRFREIGLRALGAQTHAARAPQTHANPAGPHLAPADNLPANASLLQSLHPKLPSEDNLLLEKNQQNGDQCLGEPRQGGPMEHPPPKRGVRGPRQKGRQGSQLRPGLYRGGELRQGSEKCAVPQPGTPRDTPPTRRRPLDPPPLTTVTPPEAPADADLPLVVPLRALPLHNRNLNQTLHVLHLAGVQRGVQ